MNPLQGPSASLGDPTPESPKSPLSWDLQHLNEMLDYNMYNTFTWLDNKKIKTGHSEIAPPQLLSPSPSPPPPLLSFSPSSPAHALVCTHSPTTMLSSWCVLPGCLNAHTGRHECLSFPTSVFFDGGTPPAVLRCAFFLNIICWDNFQVRTERTSPFSFLAEWYSTVWAHCKYFPGVY